MADVSARLLKQRSHASEVHTSRVMSMMEAGYVRTREAEHQPSGPHESIPSEAQHPRHPMRRSAKKAASRRASSTLLDANTMTTTPRDPSSSLMQRLVEPPHPPRDAVMRLSERKLERRRTLEEVVLRYQKAVGAGGGMASRWEPGRRATQRLAAISVPIGEVDLLPNREVRVWGDRIHREGKPTDRSKSVFVQLLSGLQKRLGA